MKRIIIILIIVVCLISFMEISCLTQEPKPLSFGEYWNVMSEVGKAFFILGFRQGMVRCLEKLEPFISTEDMWIAHHELYELYNFMFLHLEAIITVVTDLYEDPANTYIWHSDMCQIAYHKLRGEDIEPLLREARKEALPLELEK